jgi:hypothetical protein
MSSLSFLGNASSYLKIPNAPGLQLGTGDFTIEWYQYQTDSNSFPRIFQMGTFSEGEGTTFGVSIEPLVGSTSAKFYYWMNGVKDGYPVKTLSFSSYKNVWVHFAICRSSGTTKIFMNGTSILYMSDTTNYNGNKDLVIGNETIPANNTTFGGYMAYFRWIKGDALYTTNFTVSTSIPSLTNNTVLLLTASGSTGTLGSTVVNNNVSTTSNVPPILPPTYNTVTNVSNQRYYMPLFTDNSLVFYKKGSLASCGVGSVRNSSVKYRKI